LKDALLKHKEYFPFVQFPPLKACKALQEKWNFISHKWVFLYHFLRLLPVDVKLTIWNFDRYFCRTNIARFLQQLNLRGLKSALEDPLFGILMSKRY